MPGLTSPQTRAPQTVVGVARAKLNLYLHVVGRRLDGYHLLDSLAVFVDYGDFLKVSPGEDLQLTITGPFAAGLEGDPARNLVYRAAEALRNAATRHQLTSGKTFAANIELNKRLPLASGLGGGSSDAAQCLILLNQFWDLNFPLDALLKLAMPLGADVPVCLSGRPAFMRGIGEELLLLPDIPLLSVLLVNPGIAVPTAEIFRARNGPFNRPASADAKRWQESLSNSAAFCHQLSKLENDLTAPAIRICPEIAEILALLVQQEECLLARMSGSGATCFGLFEEPQAAEAAALEIGRLHRDWWVMHTAFYQPGGK